MPALSPLTRRRGTCRFAKTTPCAEVEAKMAGLLTMRVLQEYNEYTGANPYC